MSGAIGESRVRMLVAAGLLCSAAAVCSGGERILTHSEYQLKKMVEKEDAARDRRIADEQKAFADAKAIWQSGKQADARVKLDQSLTRLGMIPGNQALNRYADLISEYNQMAEAWGRERLEEARRKYAAGDYAGAIADSADILTSYRSAHGFAYVTRNGARMLAIPGDLYEDWMKRERAFAAELDVLTQKSQARLKAVEKARETALPKFDENYSANKTEIERLKREANTYIQQKKYDSAISSLEKVYLIDPFDVYATSMLKKLYNRIYTAGVARREADVQGMLAAAMWRWVEPVSMGDDNKSGEEGESQAPSADMFAKLDRIILPSLEFKDSDVEAVIKHLNQRSRSYDPKHEGVNFSISMTKEERSKLLKVDMSFSNIPLSEALRYICQDLGLKYRVDNDGVTIGKSVDNMQTRVFPVRVDLISKITDEVKASTGGGESSDGMGGGDAGGGDAGGGDAGGGDAGGGDAGGGDASGGGGEASGSKDVLDEGTDYTSVGLVTNRGRKKSATPAQLMAAFKSWGVPFGPGTTASYEPRSNRLRVTNTVENLLRLGKLLRQMDAVETPLVLVEVKLLEVTESDHQELGFDWAFNMDKTNSNSNSTNNNWYVNTFNPVRASKIPEEEGTGTGLELINNLKILPNFGNGLIKGAKMDLSLTINAVSQNSRVETLSAPKLITTNGNEASIRLTRMHYYPEEWEEPEVDSSGDVISVTQPVPEWGDTGTELGIMLSVRPQVDPNNSDITLELEPVVTSYIGKTDDTVTVSGGYINYNDQGERQMQRTWENIYEVWMPIIGERRLKTTVKVKDGETLVLGGMVDNKMQSVYDRWPVLGDIPLIGRLFSSQYEIQENTNLMVFVTARLVDNNGSPIEQNVQRDIPDFRR